MLGLLAPLASLLGIEVEALKERLQRHALFYAAVGLFVAIGGAFLLVALDNALTLSLGPVIAPLIIAGGALLIALVIYVVSLAVNTIKRQREAERRRNTETTALVTSAAISALPILFRSGLMKKVGIPVGGVLAAVYLLTRNTGRPE
jgi:hypothetical protein